MPTSAWVLIDFHGSNHHRAGQVALLQGHSTRGDVQLVLPALPTFQVCVTLLNCNVPGSCSSSHAAVSLALDQVGRYAARDFRVVIDTRLALPSLAIVSATPSGSMHVPARSTLLALRASLELSRPSLARPSNGPTSCLLAQASRPLAAPRHEPTCCPRALHSSSQQNSEKSSAQRASDLNQQGMDFQVKEVNDQVNEENQKKARTPWHREGSDLPPVARPRSAGAMTKGRTNQNESSGVELEADFEPGKLLTTPSRLLKLILPLTTMDKNSDRKDIEPLALLVHPQQPLSYLERLIQSELPRLQNSHGDEKIPTVHFRAEDAVRDEDSLMPKRNQAHGEGNEEMEETRFDGETHKTGKITPEKSRGLRGGPGEGGVESYSGLGHETPTEEEPKDKKFVRWSSSTEIGDFIRDAARGKEFAVEVEGSAENIYVGVPSFGDRTHYLRTRLRKTSKKIAKMASVKAECDMAAHTRGQRIAMGGLGLLAGWWYVVYRLTFETDLGWDTMVGIPCFNTWTRL